MSTDELHWQNVNTLDALNDLWPHWDALVGRCHVDPLFNSSKWLVPWIQHYWQPDWRLAVQVAWHHDKAVAILPLYVQPGTAVSYPLGQGEPEHMEVASEYLDVLIDPAWFERVKNELLSYIQSSARQLRWRAILSDADISTLLKHHAKTTKPAMRYLTDTATFSRSSLSKNTRVQHNRSLNKLARQHTFTRRWATPDEYPALFEKLRTLHDTRWQQAGKDGAFQSEQFVAFHKQLMAQPDSTAISVLDVEGEPAAVHYYLKTGDTLYFYQSGWDSERFQSFSPGLLLHCWSIEHTTSSYYDFMMGSANSSYKSKLATLEKPMLSLVVPFSLTGRVRLQIKRMLRFLR